MRIRIMNHNLSPQQKPCEEAFDVPRKVIATIVKRVERNSFLDPEPLFVEELEERTIIDWFVDLTTAEDFFTLCDKYPNVLVIKNIQNELVVIIDHYGE